MQNHTVRSYRSSEQIKRSDQLAWKLAVAATDAVEVESDVVEMIGNRVIDNAAVALASLNRQPVITARAQALGHRRPGNSGATLFGLPEAVQVDAEWAAWANGTAVRELDFHDTFLAADYSHPADNIPPLLAVAQQLQLTGSDLVRGIAAAYEIHVNLVRGICLHEHKVDHIAHLGPSVAGGIAAMCRLDTEVAYQAIQQALHTTISTRQSRKGEISSWKAFAPGHAGKAGIEAVDRAMRGEKSPSPIYEGEDSVIAWILGGPEAEYVVPLPEVGEPKRAILDTYTKEHSAEYQAQALIDVAFDMRSAIPDLSTISEVVIHTSHHTHNVIGTGAEDPEKMDPNASRETLDHSIMYIFAVALLDGKWNHVTSYSQTDRPELVQLWHKISTVEDPEWTQRYHSSDPAKKAFGGRVEIVFADGSRLVDERAVANAHPLGPTPFTRDNYVVKYHTLTAGVVSETASQTFLEFVDGLAECSASQLLRLLPEAASPVVESDFKGIF